MLVTRQPLVLEDVASDPRFARELAEGTGYVPRGLMAVPLLHEERALGVLEVLDRQASFTLADMDLLSLFAGQAGIALDLLQKGRRARALLDGGPDELAAVARLAAALEDTEDEARESRRTRCSPRSRRCWRGSERRADAPPSAQAPLALLSLCPSTSGSSSSRREARVFFVRAFVLSLLELVALDVGLAPQLSPLLLRHRPSFCRRAGWRAFPPDGRERLHLPTASA